MQKIFKLTLTGYGVDQIAGELGKEKVLSPINYWKTKGINRPGRTNDKSPYFWSGATISRILVQQEYLGMLLTSKPTPSLIRTKKGAKTRNG